MKPSRPLLHALRIADEILFYPAVLVVIWGELSSAPEPQIFDWLGELKDKALHFTAYFGLAAMAAAALKRRPAIYSASFGLVALGGVLEVIQGYTGRDMSAFDEVANTLGVVAGAFTGGTVVGFLRRRLGYH